MADEQTADFFAPSSDPPASSDEQMADFFAPPSDPPAEAPLEPPSDAPILMGPPTDAPPSDANDFMMDFAAPAPPSTDAPYEPPTGGDVYDYIGEVNEASAAGEAPIVLEPPQDAPIIFGGAEPNLVEDVFEEEEPPSEPEGPSPMAKWNAEWQVTLRERKDVENSEKAAVIEAARAEIESFNNERAVKLESRKNRNRETELAKLKEMEEDLEQDNSWERVVKLIDLTQDSVERSAEVKRMRDVIITLKNDKERANLLS